MIPDTPSTSLPSSLPDPRKRPSSSSPEAPEPKKRKSTHERAPVNSSGEFWEIKDICDERINQGVLEYLVEWKDINPRTGRPYKPSWEPSVNVTDDAIEVWQSRNGAVLPGSQSDVNSSQLFSLSQSSEAALRQDSAGVGTSILDAELEEDDITLLGQRQQERRRLRRHQYVVLDSQDLDSQDLVRQGQTPGQLLSGFSPELQEERRRDLVVELPQDIALDAAEYRHIRSSQLQSSQSQDYQGDVSFPSQDGSLHFQSSSLQELSSLPAALSNKTIPDSQDLSGYDLSEAADSGPQQALALSVVHSQHQEISPISTGGQPKSSAQSPDKDSGSQSDIPSHQPEQGGLDCLNPGYAEPLTHPLRSQLIPGSPTITTQNSTLQFRRAFAAHSQDVVGFLSQIPFELDDLSSSLQPSQKSSAKHSAEIYLSQVQLSSDLGPTSQASPQAAQVLPQSINHSEGIQSLNRSGAEFHVHNDELVIVPETVRKHRNSHLAHQEQSPALSELDGNSRTSSYNSRDRAAGLQVEHTSICSPQIPINRSSDEQAVRQLEDKTVSSPLQSQLNDPPQPQDGSPIIRPSSPQVTTPTPSMDDQLTTSTPLSARERLRRIREETYGSLMSPSQAPAPPVQAIETNDTPANSEQPAHLEQVDQAEQAREPAVPEQPEQLEPAEEPDQPALPEQLDFSVPILAPYLLEPSIVTGPQDDAGPDFGSKSDGPLPLEQPVFDSGTLDASYGPPPEEQPATLDPSALTLSIENDVPESPSIPTDDGVAPDGHPTDSVDEPEEADHAVSNEEHGEYFEGDLLPYIPSGANEYLLTLPLASNIRPQYIQIIQETSRDLAAYNSALAESRTPEPSLVAKVDRMFTRLFDICDLPPFLETLPSISPQSITKHIRQTNSKFAFVAQFLEYLGRLESEKKILILARPGQVIDLLNNIVETEGYRHIRLADGVVHCSWEQQHQLTVTVASTSESLSPLPSDFDVIIAFDHTFRQEQLKPRHVDNPPLLLALVTATSIEHLNMRISDKIELLERKNVLLLALCASLRVMEYPEPGFPQAHEMARDFANFAENPDDDDFYWTPQSIPESIFANIAASSQEVIPSNVITGEPGDRSSRKRSLDEAEELSSKRPRLEQPRAVTTDSTRLIPEIIANIVAEGKTPSPDAPTVEIPIYGLEILAAKIAKLEADLEETRAQKDEFRQLADRTKQEVDSWTASLKRIQPRYMVALKDRGTFQSERDAARRDAKNLATLLETSRSTNGTLKETNAELKQKLSEATESLLNSGNPDLVKLARVEKELEEANLKVADLQKKLVSAEKDMDFIRDQYQSASQGARELKIENDNLQQQTVELRRTANDNIVRIREIQASNEVRELTRLLDEQRSIVRERENELNHVREQISTMKNGRRETRQTSVPRSPHLGVMSPRNPGKAGVAPVNASRGVSPAAAIGIYDPTAGGLGGIGSLFPGQQQGNGRFSHLRD